jgi:hypothetical protein
MNKKKYMTLSFWAVCSAVLLYELVALNNAVDEDTITAIIRKNTEKHPMIPFVAGVIMGHFFWDK